MEKHIISNCLKVDYSIREAVIYMVEACEREISSGTNIKRQNNDQTILEDFYENSYLIEHLFIIELFKQLRSNYSLPDRKTLADTMLTQEILRVNVKLYRLLDTGQMMTNGGPIRWKSGHLISILLVPYFFCLLSIGGIPIATKKWLKKRTLGFQSGYLNRVQSDI
ncbi:hypothetical protein C1646_775389 [Rhizophagus diaphanus]|nr:hypothetical protein C1646_775389 [Rhizophagus diaphanus] [Rhizophagus sp. MUCL 43196]